MSAEAPSHTAPMPYVSVVIPTFHRPALLRRCLEAIVAQDYAPDRFDVTVVEDGGPGPSESVLAEIGRSTGVLLRALAVPRSGPAAARNAGWRGARGEIIAFTDDDTIPAPDWLSQGVRTIQSGADAVSGRTIVPLPSRPSDAQRNVQGLERASLATCNAFCRRTWLKAIGGFDERFTRAYREDTDLEFSLRRAGARLEHNPQAVVVHPPRDEPWLVSLRQQRNQFFDALLYRKHPEMFRRSIRARPPLMYYGITIGQLATVACALMGRGGGAGVTTLAWLPLVLGFCLRRSIGSRGDLGHTAEMLISSVVIPPLAVFWRVRGAWAFRTPFL